MRAAVFFCLAAACTRGSSATCLSSASCVQIEPWSSSGGANFLKLTISTPGNVVFTTLRLTLNTDAVIDESVAQAYAFIATDSLFPMQAGTGVFKAGAAEWVDYSVTLNQSPPEGYAGFVLLLSTGAPRTSPGEFYILLSSVATYVNSVSVDPIQLADGQMPSQLMVTPIVESSLMPEAPVGPVMPPPAHPLPSLPPPLPSSPPQTPSPLPVPPPAPPPLQPPKVPPPPSPPLPPLLPPQTPPLPKFPPLAPGTHWVEPGWGTLETALSAASSGDELVLADGCFTLLHHSVLQVSNRNLTIRAQKLGQAVLQGPNYRQVMSIEAGAVVLDGLMMQGGLSIAESADVILNSCSVVNSEESGISVDDATVHAHNCSITDNSTPGNVIACNVRNHPEGLAISCRL